MKLCMLDVCPAHAVSLNEAVCVLTARITAWSSKQWPCLVPHNGAFEGEFFSLFVFRLLLHAGASPWPVCGSQEAVSLTSMSEHGFTSLYIWYPLFSLSLSFFFFFVRSDLGQVKSGQSLDWSGLLEKGDGGRRGERWGTIQQRSSSNLFRGRPSWTVPSRAGTSLFWFFDVHSLSIQYFSPFKERQTVP